MCMHVCVYRHAVTIFCCPDVHIKTNLTQIVHQILYSSKET